MNRFFTSGLPALALAGAAMTLAACNTTAGFGQDMKAAGQAITNSAEKVENGGATPNGTQPQTTSTAQPSSSRQ